MLAIYKREMRYFFTSPVGYVFVAIFFAISAAIFMALTVQAGENANYNSYFSYIIMLCIVEIPLLTMKLLSEERKMKTEQLLLTSPVGLSAMVFAKFAAAFTMFFGMFVLSTVINTAVLGAFGEVNYAVIIGNGVGILLIGAAFCAVGCFFSSLTENQIVAAVSTITALGALVGLNLINLFLSSGFLKSIISWISIWERYNDFTYGTLNLGSLIYFASFVVAFLFLTIRVFEKKRWA